MMEKKMETTGLYGDYIGIIGLYRGNIRVI